MASFGVMDRPAGPQPFRTYALDDAYDEMFSAPDVPRAQYEPVHDLLLDLADR